MPRILRKALFEKLRESKEVRQFQEDFQLATGLVVAFVDELGIKGDAVCPVSPLCAALLQEECGQRLCQRTRQALLEASHEHAGSIVCDAGLREAAIPVRVGSITVGFFLFGGATQPDRELRNLRRTKHLLEKAGLSYSLAEIERLQAGGVEAGAELWDAYVRLVSLAARQTALAVTARLDEPVDELPETVAKACRIIRQHAHEEDVDLPFVAGRCAMSAGHLSRLFHKATGLTFREYLGRVRVDRAQHLLATTRKNATEIAFASGFQSVSQFHRTFKKVVGYPPLHQRRRGFLEE